ncbi:sulfurtransferase TusA family protein [Ancylobacter pratisalsi]|uniref:Sulfurtransferase TusA family protein n=1 Tax=Ancylobacter pratisalsi TaxID=1745854 RepID=A0A6P1YT17_9HYPH|nr:sulfurtransferase TusA family protein [Ancylobacter pratisalsi]QIB35846.1 sulfurtransferase TusA family protein [Ancylobacter pratisalsi]
MDDSANSREDGADNSANAPVRLDLKGLKCPLPALHTRRALERAAPGTRLVVECTDPMAAIDIPHLVNQTGNELEGQETNAVPLVFRIRKRLI